MIQIISQTPSVMLNYESLAHYLIGSVHQHLGFLIQKIIMYQVSVVLMDT